METNHPGYKANELDILRLAVENTTEAFVTIDETHRILFFNKAAEDLFGFKKKEVIGRDLDILLGKTCREGHRQAIERYLNGEKKQLPHHEKEFMITNRGGEAIPVTFSFSVAKFNGRHYFTAIIRDMSDIKICHDRLLKSERLAALGQLVAEIVHEIRNPLVLIGGFTRQLKRTISDDKSSKKIDIILKEVQRLENLLAELKELYLPKDLNISVFDVNELLRELYVLAKADCKNRNIKIQFESDSDEAFIEGDREKIKQVFLNLIKNAVEALENGGMLRIESKRNGAFVEVLVSDDGPGIPEEHLGKVFSPFFTTKKYGTGLGLSISKRIIDQHKGYSISLDTNKRRGTTFKVTIPLAKKASA